jgi:hypothetical protein
MLHQHFRCCLSPISSDQKITLRVPVVPAEGSDAYLLGYNIGFWVCVVLVLLLCHTVYFYVDF